MDFESLKSDYFHLRAALKLLADAAEEFASSDPEMVGHRDAEAAFEDALAGARAVLEGTSHDEPPPRD